MENMKISNTGGKYKRTKLNYKMTITNETVFTDSDHHVITAFCLNKLLRDLQRNS